MPDDLLLINNVFELIDSKLLVKNNGFVNLSHYLICFNVQPTKIAQINRRKSFIEQNKHTNFSISTSQPLSGQRSILKKFEKDKNLCRKFAVM